MLKDLMYQFMLPQIIQIPHDSVVFAQLLFSHLKRSLSLNHQFFDVYFF